MVLRNMIFVPLKPYIERMRMRVRTGACCVRTNILVQLESRFVIVDRKSAIAVAERQNKPIQFCCCLIPGDAPLQNKPPPLYVHLKYDGG